MYALLALITAFLTPLFQHAFLAVLRRCGVGDRDLADTALFFGGFTALVLFGIMLNLFSNYLWRGRIGALMFQFSGLSIPPNLTGEYRGNIEISSAANPTAISRSGYVLRVAQTWEQIILIIERNSETRGQERVRSDMASIRFGMMTGIVELWFVYTFAEHVPRSEGVGTMSRQYRGAATFEFRREGETWAVEGHFFDDIGRSGQINLKQVPPDPTVIP
jgi:hypothetical protein